MASNLYRFSILGETLEKTLTSLQEKKGTSNEVLEKIREKFDTVANRNICDENKMREKGKTNHTTQINAIEHEFKFHDGVWRFLLKKVMIKMECEEVQTDFLKVIACNLENPRGQGRRAGGGKKIKGVLR